MGSRKKALVAAVLVGLFVLGALATRPVSADTRLGATSLRLIVHPENPIAAVDRRFVADVFLKKTTRWSADQVIRPVDLEPESPVRRLFSDQVLKRSVDAVRSYWQQQVFSGRGVPPPELEDEGQIVKFVLRTPGAIGYVSGNADVQGARVVQVR